MSMIYLPEEEASHLMDMARKAAERTYSPYSHFPVGAAVLAADGSVYCGTNVENASYSITICAERTALGYTIATGQTDIKAIAVWSGTASISPCGACRQFIIEFGKDIVIIFKHKQGLMQRTIQELLPFEFTKTTME